MDMDDYETAIERQASGPFNNRRERKTLRAVAEHWVGRQRYSEERSRRVKRYAGWIAVAAPAALAIIKFAESLIGKGL